MITLLMAALIYPAQDTVTLSLNAALTELEATALDVEAARRRSERAQSLMDQAEAWSNPMLQVTAENLGQTKAITGTSGWRGTEGQIVLSYLMPLGGDRAARIAESGAEVRFREAEERELLRRSMEELVVLAARAVRDRAVASLARDEAEGLQELSRALVRQAEAGRLSDGEAARAHLAAVSAWARHSTLAAQSEVADAELSARLGRPVTTEVTIDLPTCSAPALTDVRPTPGRRMFEARMDLASARVARARAASIPDLTPQIGVRRGATVSALYVGLGIPIPLLDRRGSQKRAALLEREAANADLAHADKRLEAERAGALSALRQLDRVGSMFDGAWVTSLERAVEATEARYRLGEGTLTELLDSRAARYAAQVSRLRWEADRWAWRARWQRASGNPMNTESLCGGR